MKFIRNKAVAIIGKTFVLHIHIYSSDIYIARVKSGYTAYKNVIHIILIYLHLLPFIYIPTYFIPT